MTITIVTGVGCSMLVVADCIHRFGAMGDLFLDAVLAVSSLAMVSAVVWADWVISCCGVSSEAMSLMVR